jgi:hypothetical protein
MVYISNGFGLGYYDENGKLTHHLWMRIKGEQGPGEIWWMSYRSYDQFLELMALVKSMGDQVLSVAITEPPGIQFQDLLHKPFAKRETTKRGPYANYMESSAYWQFRILDLPGCMEKTHLRGNDVCFNLELHDPIGNHAKSGSSWHGVEGPFVVKLGRASSAEPGRATDLPTLKASVGAFTRLWMGVGNAVGLSVTDDLHGPEHLLRSLSEALTIPVPKTDWDF